MCVVKYDLINRYITYQVSKQKIEKLIENDYTKNQILIAFYSEKIKDKNYNISSPRLFLYMDGDKKYFQININEEKFLVKGMIFLIYQNGDEFGTTIIDSINNHTVYSSIQEFPDKLLDIKYDYSLKLQYASKFDSCDSCLISELYQDISKYSSKWIEDLL